MAKEKRDRQGDKQQPEAKPAQAQHSAKETPRLQEPLPRQSRPR